MRRCASRSTLALAALTAVGLSSCFPEGPDFEEPRFIRGVRVIAVTVDPPSGTPGARVSLDLDAIDPLMHPAVRAAGSDDADAAPPPPLQIAWLGGCHNPPGDAQYGCLQLLHQSVGALPEGMALADLLADAPAGLPFAFGPEFSETIPSDILEGRALTPASVPYGVSFVFFAVCRGTLVVLPENEGVPIGCVDDAGNRLGAEAFVHGFTTIYTYAGVENHNPIIRRQLFDGVELPEQACNDDADCAPFESGALKLGCAVPLETTGALPARRCLPKVPPCTPPSCAGHALDFELDPKAIERDPARADATGHVPTESMWVKYFSLGGNGRGQVLLSDPSAGFNPDHGTRWHAPGRPSDVPFPTWGVVQDERGGTTPLRWDILVRDE